MMNVDAFIVRDNERLSERILVEVVDVVQASVDERKVGLWYMQEQSKQNMALRLLSLAVALKLLSLNYA